MEDVVPSVTTNVITEPAVITQDPDCNVPHC